ncbi:hypothetical protein TRIP_C60057 [Candidatus Zixiibacteriota bacterium]|nr:hypothetical protein TRIP_C60057 [candidate division Zixibacteria bacterium]
MSEEAKPALFCDTKPINLRRLHVRKRNGGSMLRGAKSGFRGYRKNFTKQTQLSVCRCSLGGYRKFRRLCFISDVAGQEVMKANFREDVETPSSGWRRIQGISTYRIHAGSSLWGKVMKGIVGAYGNTPQQNNAAHRLRHIYMRG